MTPELAGAPDWVQQIDLDWIEQNYTAFKSATAEMYDQLGRGLVAVDLTRSYVTGGHPFCYWSQSHIREHADDEVNCLVEEYDPREEMVVMLLKPDDVICTYRVLPAFPY